MILAFFAHPDDETYSAAGALASFSDAGERVVVVSATAGEGGRDRRGRQGDLAALRRRELEASCALLGAEARVWDLPDGGVRDRAREATARLRGAIEELSPHTLVTHGRDGAYGHVDHIACADIVDASGFGGRILRAAFPVGLFAPLQRALRRAVPHLIADVALGSAHWDHEVRLDAALRRRKLAAIAAHASQLDGGDPMTFLWPGIVEATLACERFAT